MINVRCEQMWISKAELHQKQHKSIVWSLSSSAFSLSHTVFVFSLYIHFPASLVLFYSLFNTPTLSVAKGSSPCIIHSGNHQPNHHSISSIGFMFIKAVIHKYINISNVPAFTVRLSMHLCPCICHCSKNSLLSMMRYVGADEEKKLIKWLQHCTKCDH